MFCSKCGSENLDSAKFCKSCGNPIRASVHPVYTNNPGMDLKNNLKNAWGCYLEVFRKYAVFNGRASREEYWTFKVFNFVFLFIAVILIDKIGADIFIWISLFCYLAILIPSLAVTVRRLHDTGRSGWMYFVPWIPLVGPIIFLVFMVSESTPGMNKYGPSPKGRIVN